MKRLGGEDPAGVGPLKVGDELHGQFRLRRHEYLRGAAGAEAALDRDLDRFLDSPSEPALHDLRVAVRRLDAYMELLPKRVRKTKETGRFAKRLRRLLERTAAVRDLDAIRLKAVGYQDGSAKERLLSRVRKDRRRLLGDALAAAASVKELLPAVLRAHDVDGEVLQTRLTKVTADLTAKIDGLLPVVVGDPRSVKDLHRLRIDCKRLRYTLELAEGGAASGAMATLKDLQDALGAVHDSDVAGMYLGKMGGTARGLATRERGVRSREFRRLAQVARRGRAGKALRGSGRPSVK